MLRRISQLSIAVVFAVALLLAGVAGTPAHASHGEAGYIEDVVHRADIDHIMQQIHAALTHGRGLDLADHDVVYNALGRTSTAIDLLYDSGATGDVFNAAEHLLTTQHELLQEVEHATLTGDIGDLSTVTSSLVELAQARLAFDRQTTFGHDGHFPSTRSHLDSSLRFNRGLQHDGNLFNRRHVSPSRSFSSPLHRSHPGRSFLDSRRHRTFDRFGHFDLRRQRLYRYYNR